MFLIHEKSYNSENPVYMKLPNEKNSLFIPEARVAKDYFNTGFYERAYVDWSMDNFIQNDKNVIDIGAHIGWYTTKFAEKSKHVYAFECSPKSFNYLCANIALNELDYKVTKYNVALSNETGLTPYYIRDPKDGGGNGIACFETDKTNNIPFINVPRTTLDSFNIENVNFIKIDVEGHEKSVLEGARNTIVKNNYPKILFESWDEHHELDCKPSKQLQKELFEYLNEIGYNRIIRIGLDMYLAERVL